MNKIIMTALIALCADCFAQIENPVEYTERIIAAESADDVDQYLALYTAATDEAEFKALIGKSGSLEQLRETLETYFAQKAPYDADSLWVTDDFNEAFQNASSLKSLFGGKKLKAGYKIVMYGDKANSGFLLYQATNDQWVIRDYPPMGKGLFVED